MSQNCLKILLLLTAFVELGLELAKNVALSKKKRPQTFRMATHSATSKLYSFVFNLDSKMARTPLNLMTVTMQLICIGYRLEGTVLGEFLIVLKMIIALIIYELHTEM